MKLNLGCGDHYAAGWVNVDAVRNAQVTPDMVLDITQPLPFEPGSVELIYAGHVLEHLEQDRVADTLAMWRGYLAPAGALCVVGPDCDRAQRLHTRRKLDERQLNGVRYGAGRWTGDVHLWESTEMATLELLDLAGWDATPVPVALLDDRWPLVSPAAWQFAVLAWPR